MIDSVWHRLICAQKEIAYGHNPDQFKVCHTTSVG
jgi:hypothetical protein